MNKTIQYAHPCNVMDVKYCHSVQVHIKSNFAWVYMFPTVHQMLGHNWELLAITNGKPIGVWSETGLEEWNKHIRSYRQGVACRARQTSVTDNISDILRRMLKVSAPIIAKTRTELVKSAGNRHNAEHHIRTADDILISQMYI